MPLNITDVRDQMPNYENYKDWQRPGDILGVAVHHSATADPATGAPTGDAFSYFDYHVNVRGWSHGGYNYVITGNAEIQYALDDKIAAYHAGFKDPNDELGLENGQYWNNHYLAICLSGWFSENRTYNGTQQIPNNYTYPSQNQQEALLALIRFLQQKYNIPVENVRGHRELAGNYTHCPGLNLDPAQLRAQLQQGPPPVLTTLPTPLPGEHGLILPDTGAYLSSALGYIWKFQPDVSFAPQVAAQRWPYITAIGNINPDLLAEYSQYAQLVQHIEGSPAEVQQQLDELVAQNQRFQPLPTDTPPDPEPDDSLMYTVQPGDTLTRIALQFYGQASLWTVIYNANRDIISDPGHLVVGQVITIPPRP